MGRGPRLDRSAAQIVRLSLAGAVLAGVLAAVVAVASGAVTADQAWRKVFDSLVTLAGALVLTGGVGVVIEEANRRREARAHDREDRLALVDRLRAVHSDLLRAARLIDAHRTARTYGEQMRALVETRVELSNLSFAVRHAGSLAPPARAALEIEIDTVADYVKALIAEYREQYPRVSAIQMATHEWELAHARQLANRTEPPQPQEISASTVAWTELTDRAVFPHLGTLLDGLGPAAVAAAHDAGVTDPIRRAVDVLLAPDDPPARVRP